MEEENKKRVSWGIKVTALLIWMLCVVATCVYLWNYSHSALAVAVSSVSLIGAIVGAINLGKKIESKP